MQAQWKQWVLTNLLRNVPVTQLYTTLLGEGFAHAEIVALLGNNLPPAQQQTLARQYIARYPEPKFLAEEQSDNVHSDNVQILESDQAQLFVVKDFLALPTCENIVALSKQHLRPSTITTASTEADTAFRTSSTCDLVSLDSDIAHQVSAHIIDYFGFAKGNNEPIQAQHYAPGQQFKAHTDYFEPGTSEYRQFASQLGQRTWTCMVYLNEVEAGGETEFVKLGKSFTPHPGTAVIWNNLLPDGRPNANTLHHAHPVIKGEKVVITKWFREAV
ncbi:2OG-Fe(II) oxygenase [Alteromonas sp. ZYF713]|nr:2OG-Fe(II) oxygenase [Alteromonas sp. ZYF713]